MCFFRTVRVREVYTDSALINNDKLKGREALYIIMQIWMGIYSAAIFF